MGGNLFQLPVGSVGGRDNRDNRARLGSKGGLHCGSVKIFFFRVGAFWLRGLRRYPVFLWHVAPVVPFCKGVAVVVDIALFGKHTIVVNGSVPPVFLIHEIPFHFVG